MASARLEQLDGIAGRVVGQYLAAALAVDDGAAEADAAPAVQAATWWERDGFVVGIVEESVLGDIWVMPGMYHWHYLQHGTRPGNAGRVLRAGTDRKTESPHLGPIR